MFDQLSLGLFEQYKVQEIHAVEDLGNDDSRVVGPELVFGLIFDRIGYNQIPEPLFRDLVISRSFSGYPTSIWTIWSTSAGILA